VAVEIVLFVVVIIRFSVVFILKSAVSFFSPLVPAVAIPVVAISFVIALLASLVLSLRWRRRGWGFVDHFIHDGTFIVQHHGQIF